MSRNKRAYRKSGPGAIDSGLLRVRFFRPLKEPTRSALAAAALDSLICPYRMRGGKDPEMTVVAVAEHALPLLSFSRMEEKIREIKNSEHIDALTDDLAMDMKPARFGSALGSVTGNTLVVVKPCSKKGYRAFIDDRAAILGNEKSMLGEGKNTIPHITLGVLPGKVGMRLDQDTKRIPCLLGGLSALIYRVDGHGRIDEAYRGPIVDFYDGSLSDL